MKTLACGPLPLLDHLQQRLASQTLPPLHFSNGISADLLQSLNRGDCLLLIQPPAVEPARQLAQTLQAQAIHYIEACICDSPFGATYGFALTVAGTPDDIRLIKPILDALAPITDGWWHVGPAGAAAFIGQLQQYSPINPLNLGQIPNEPGGLPQKLVQSCRDYLAFSDNENFVSCHPDRQRALTHFLNPSDSPARQLAMMLSTFAPKKNPASSSVHSQ